MGHKAVDNFTLERWRGLDSIAVLKILAIHIAQIPSSSRAGTRTLGS
jgi:hypothetical protein